MIGATGTELTAKDMFDGSPGEPYRAWRRNTLNAAAATTDKSGSSLADHLLDVDMGGAGVGAPAMPAGGGAAGQRLLQELQALRRARSRGA